MLNSCFLDKAPDDTDELVKAISRSIGDCDKCAFVKICRQNNDASVDCEKIIGQMVAGVIK